jgi:DNA-binding response OmpR family regulator
MTAHDESIDTVLIVDDEHSVRQTFQEWLEEAELGCRILTAPDAETALIEANRHSVDLAILDWNLGAGNDGLKLLEDLFVFHPDIVAIMVTGYAHQATPLDAMRMGVRDYLDKNQDLGRDSFLRSVRRQLERIRPAKQQRRLHRSLAAFRHAVDQTLPLLQYAATLTDPVPLSESVRALFQFLLRSTGAQDGALITRSYDPAREPKEIYRAYDSKGQAIDGDLVPFDHSLAALVLSMQQPIAWVGFAGQEPVAPAQLQSFENGRKSFLAVPLAVAPDVQVVLELFDKDPRPDEGFTRADQDLVASVKEFAVELLRHALAERQSFQVLATALASARRASQSMEQSLEGSHAAEQKSRVEQDICDHVRKQLAEATGPENYAASIRLAEGIRLLGLRHGSAALAHCTQLIEQVHQLLDRIAGTP